MASRVSYHSDLIADVMCHLRSLGQRSVNRYYSDPSLVFEVHIVKKSCKNNIVTVAQISK